MSDIIYLILGILGLTSDQKSGDFHFFGNQAKKGTELTKDKGLY